MEWYVREKKEGEVRERRSSPDNTPEKLSSPHLTSRPLIDLYTEIKNMTFRDKCSCMLKKVRMMITLVKMMINLAHCPAQT
jgi:hypothetical protein